MGDSTTRGPFCAYVWERVHGTVAGTLCDYREDLKNYWIEKGSNKFTSKVFAEDADYRNISFTFLWSPKDLPAVTDMLLSLDPFPTHVVFNMGLCFYS